VSAFESSAVDCRAQLLAWNALPTGKTVLDLGCGPGAMALALAGDLAPRGRFVGIDVHAPSIAWCRRRFADDPRFRFERADVVSAYGRGSASLSEYRLPLEDASIDLVLAKSLFTHLSESEAGRYLAEIRRVMAPGGKALVTAFLLGEGRAPAFPFGDDRIRWRVKNRPAAATAFARPLFESMIEGAGLRIECGALGFFPGDSPRITGQDVLLLARK
jgi:SAM-dependent methyltransferase